MMMNSVEATRSRIVLKFQATFAAATHIVYACYSIRPPSISACECSPLWGAGDSTTLCSNVSILLGNCTRCVHVCVCAPMCTYVCVRVCARIWEYSCALCMCVTTCVFTFVHAHKRQILLKQGSSRLCSFRRVLLYAFYCCPFQHIYIWNTQAPTKPTFLCQTSSQLSSYQNQKTM
jgi:hypothetical protein